MIYLILTIIGASMFTFILRLSRGRISGKYAMYAADYFLCLILSGYYMGYGNIYPAVDRNDIIQLPVLHSEERCRTSDHLLKTGRYDTASYIDPAFSRNTNVPSDHRCNFSSRVYGADQL